VRLDAGRKTNGRRNSLPVTQNTTKMTIHATRMRAGRRAGLPGTAEERRRS